MEGVKAEPVGEEAKEVIYDDSFALLKNQVLICGRQWQRMIQLRRSSCEVAISDSPLRQGMLYVEDAPYYHELFALVTKLELEIPHTYNMWINPVKPYGQFGRYQNEEEAKALNIKAPQLIRKFWLKVDGNRHGVHHLAENILRLLAESRKETEADLIGCLES
jgi:hypothetical protein